MNKIYAYTVDCCLKDLMKRGKWTAEEYFSSFDINEAEVVSTNSSEWATYFSESEFDFDDNAGGEPTVYVTFYVLYDEDNDIVVMSSEGDLTKEDMLEMFPEYDFCHID